MDMKRHRLSACSVAEGSLSSTIKLHHSKDANLRRRVHLVIDELETPGELKAPS